MGRLLEAVTRDMDERCEFEDGIFALLLPGIEQADAFTLRGRILRSEGSPDAFREFQRSLDLFKDLERGGADRVPAFHERFGDLLLNIAALAAGRPGPRATARRRPRRPEPRR